MTLRAVSSADLYGTPCESFKLKIIIVFCQEVCNKQELRTCFEVLFLENNLAGVAERDR